jgi:hypothetical protein
MRRAWTDGCGRLASAMLAAAEEDDAPVPAA